MVPTDHLTRQFLAWLDEEPRTYGEAMDAWRTSCPRLSVWEDALADGLVTLERAGSMREQRVVVTERGYALLGRTGAPAPIVERGAAH